MIRVGIDSGVSGGSWNAPCNPVNRDFVYVPVPSRGRYTDPLLDRYYAENIAAAVREFCQRNRCQVSIRKGLENESAHLDPDFCSRRLSYGNSLDNRAKEMLTLVAGDFVIFYNSMKPIKPLQSGNSLEYGIIGILKVQTVEPVNGRRDERNIHTRRPNLVASDVVVYGDSEESGRLEKYLPIGECKTRRGNMRSHYYVKETLAHEWGGVRGVGSIHRAVNPVRLTNPPQFFEWWGRQNPSLIHRNNP